MLLLIRQYAEPMRRRMLDALARPARTPLSPRRTAGERLRPGGGVHAERRAASLLLTGYTVLEWVLIAGCILVACCGPSRALHFGLVDVLIFMGFVSFGAVVQIPGIGGGFQVVAVLVLTELFAIRLEVATGVAMMLWVITFVVIVPVGSLLAFREA